MMSFMVCGKQIALPEQVVCDYWRIYHDVISELDVQYHAKLTNCTKDMDKEEISRRISDSFLQEFKTMEDLPRAITEAKQKGIIVDA